MQSNANSFEMSFWNKNYRVYGRTRYYKPKHFPLTEQKQLYNSLRVAFRLASRSIVVGHKGKLIYKLVCFIADSYHMLKTKFGTTRSFLLFLCIMVLSNGAARSFGCFNIELHKIFVIVGLAGVFLCLYQNERMRLQRNTVIGIATFVVGAITCFLSNNALVMLSSSGVMLTGLYYSDFFRREHKSQLLDAIVAVLVFAFLIVLYQRVAIVWYGVQAYSHRLSKFIGRTFFDLSVEEGFSAAGGLIFFSLISYTTGLWLRHRISGFVWLELMMLSFVGQIAYIILTNIQWMRSKSALFLMNTQVCYLFMTAPVFFAVLNYHTKKIYMGAAKYEWMQTKAFAIFVVIAVFIASTAGYDISFFWHSPSPKANILLLDEGYVDWDVPVFGKYGPFETGLFGMLPTYLKMIGCKAEISKDDITAKTLQNQDVLVIMNPQKYWNKDELKTIWDFVYEGGSLAVLGDHTDILGTQNSLNQLLSPVEISFNFDSGFPCRHGWHECFDLMPHCINSGVKHWHNVNISVGATIETSWPTFPIIVGKWGFADFGNRLNKRGAFLGDYWYQRGERLGDVVLVAGRHYGKGKVIVFGDTSPFQNTAFTGNMFPFFCNVMSWLSDKRISNIEDIFAKIVLVACTLILIIALRLRYMSKDIVLLIIVLWISSLFGNAVYFWQKSQPELLSGDEKIAWIDTSLFEKIPMTGPQPDGVMGVIVNLMRNGYVPLFLDNFATNQIKQGKLLVLRQPTKQIDKYKITALHDYMKIGGIVVLSAGYHDKVPIKAFLESCGLDIKDIPLGPVPVVRTDDNAAKGPQFRNAWPIVYSKDIVDSDVSTTGGFRPSEIDVLYQAGNLAVAVFAKFGRGGLLLISDGGFFYDQNIESLQGYHEGNILFIKEVFTKIHEMTNAGLLQ